MNFPISTGKSFTIILLLVVNIMAQEALPFEALDEGRRREEREEKVRRRKTWPSVMDVSRLFGYMSEQLEAVRIVLEDTVLDTAAQPPAAQAAKAAPVLRGRTLSWLSPVIAVVGQLEKRTEASCRYGAEAAAAVWLQPRKEMELDKEEEKRLKAHMIANEVAVSKWPKRRVVAAMQVAAPVQQMQLQQPVGT